MINHHPVIFHCQTCGRVVTQSHGEPPPSCCGAVMECAVSHVEKPRTVHVEKNETAREFAELSKWCRGVVDEDGTRYAELARRLRSLHDILLERFNSEERADANAVALDARLARAGMQLRQQQRDTLERVDHLIHDLRQGEGGFRGWVEVCDRVDSFADDYARHEQAEANLERSASQGQIERNAAAFMHDGDMA